MRLIGGSCSGLWILRDRFEKYSKDGVVRSHGSDTLKESNYILLICTVCFNVYLYGLLFVSFTIAIDERGDVLMK